MPVTSGTAKTVTAAGTAEPLISTVIMCTWCIIQPLNGNTDKVYIGDSTVSSANGIWLDAALGQSLTIPEATVPLYIDLNAIYVDAVVNGEGVVFLYGIR